MNYILTLLVAFPLAFSLRDDPPEDCLEQHCIATYIGITTGTVPAGITFSLMEGTEVDGHGTFECATCPEKECKVTLDIDFDPAPGNAHYMEIGGRRIVGEYDDPVTLKRNCIQDQEVEITVKILDLNNNEVLLEHNGGLSCFCEPLPE
jgi:hypothetical protein